MIQQGTENENWLVIRSNNNIQTDEVKCKYKCILDGQPALGQDRDNLQHSSEDLGHMDHGVRTTQEPSQP